MILIGEEFDEDEDFTFENEGIAIFINGDRLNQRGQRVWQDRWRPSRDSTWSPLWAAAEEIL